MLKNVIASVKKAFVSKYKGMEKNYLKKWCKKRKRKKREKKVTYTRDTVLPDLGNA